MCYVVYWLRIVQDEVAVAARGGSRARAAAWGESM